MAAVPGEIKSWLDYNTNFDAKAYLESYYVLENNPFLESMLQVLHKLGAERRIPEGSRLLDVGSGPCIQSFISAGANCKEIICSDYADQNRKELQKWVNAEDGAFDWSKTIQYVCKLEGDGGKWEKRQYNIRRAIKKVIPCDVHQSNPLAPLDLGEFDIITTSLCLEAACQDEQSFQNAVKNIVSLLKPGGVIILFGVFGQLFYTVGKERFKSLPMSLEMIERVFVHAGLIDLRCKSVDNIGQIKSFNEHIKAPSDCTDMFGVSAIKLEKS